MTRIINGALDVASFDSTGNAGEYTITNAAYASVYDPMGAGANDLHVGMVLYVQASDPNTFTQIPGVVHRYKITQLEVLDQQFINATIVWDEFGQEQDTPTNGSTSVITETTANKKLGYALPTEFFPTIAPGTAAGVANSDVANITDLATAGGGVLFTQSTPSTRWEVNHGKNSVDFVYSIYDAAQVPTWPNEIEVVDANNIIVHFLQAMTGKVVFNFV